MLLLKTMIKPVGPFAIGFLSGSCAVAFAFGGIFFHAALSGTLSPWLANGALIRGITNVMGLLCGVALVWRYPK